MEDVAIKKEDSEKENEEETPFDERPDTTPSSSAISSTQPSAREPSPAAVQDVHHETKREKARRIAAERKPIRKDEAALDEEFPFDEEPDPAGDAMSPLPFDHREDPTTLMELPENILTLPISPCGPNDGAAEKRGVITA